MTEGSQFWAAQLEDERFDEEYEKKIAELKASGGNNHPPLAGYTRLVGAIDDLTDHMYMLRAEIGRWGKPPGRPKPRYPEDRHHERLVVYSRSKVGDLLAIAHSMR